MSNQRPTRVAVDAMGGDHAPSEVVEGAVAAARESDVQVVLVGDPGPVQSELAKHDTGDLRIGVVPSEGVIAEGEPPALALRQKPRASITVATGLVKAGHADACVSMGSTGATMAASAVVLGVIEGVDRPALGGPIVGLAPRTVFIDVGTNVDCRPSQLLSFAVIGDVFARQMWGVQRPRVGLLSVGAESGKGNRQVRETSDLIASSDLNFIGNIEADELMESKADVVVCDGFVGNIVMKLTEGLGDALSKLVSSRLGNGSQGSAVADLAREIYEMTNPVETMGGGPLFGVNGVSVIGHGRARASAVARAIGTAKLVAESGFVAKVNEDLARLRSTSNNEE